MKPANFLTISVLRKVEKDKCIASELVGFVWN